MYTSSSGSPDAILEWLQNEMGYRPLRPYASSKKSSMPTADSLGNICRGNMIPVWSFLLNRVKSDRTVENIRRNILVHGAESDDGRRKEKLGVGKEELSNTREMALQERELAEKEVQRLRQIVRQQRKELKAKMIEVSKEEAERKSMLDERSNYRHKQVMLEAYDQQCNEATKILAMYHKVLQCYVKKQAKDVEKVTGFHANNESNSKSVHDIKALEGKVEGACESIANHISEKIQSSFPAYEGSGIHLNPQLEASNIGIGIDGDLPPDLDLKMIAESLSSPPQLLQAITSYTQKLKTLITAEVEKIDVRDDAEALRYNHDNNTIIEASSPDVSSLLQYHLYGNGKLGGGGIGNQLRERQKVHVQQFLATEFALNKAAEARKSIQLDLKNLHGIGNAVSSHSSINDGASENMSSLKLMVWAKEREVAGLKASLKILMSEVHRLKQLCAERKEADNSLRKKWKKIEEFDARRSELETICNALLRANMDAASFWSEQPVVAREYASSTIIPACNVVLDLSNSAKYLIDNEVSAFVRTPDNSLYMLPSTPQALLESMGASSSTGPEAFATAERNAVVLTARAGARDPTAVPSICRISAALQYPAGEVFLSFLYVFVDNIFT
ncbi:hypothetical protein RD792_006856 [Penstemon davidsonii]|uniref:AUGMIN subunit 5 n=1 Tax=Penstemon davidsonii TaxID=160366 RepID=A0ABR0DBL1_9LAMI|nr:hypothetical protein RD792_006856 [Penstemon davidsonii]